MKKIKNSFSGVIVGIILIIIGTVLLWWNEGNNVKNIKTVGEIKENVVDVSSEKVASANEGKLVATNGTVNVIDEILLDKEFNVGIKTSKLERIVEMYQWEEDTSSDDDGTTYTYEKVWSQEIIDSSNFEKSGHDNPNSMPYESQYITSDEVMIGQFYLSKKQITNLSTDTNMEVPSSAMIPLGYRNSKKYITNSVDEKNPQIGDIRISFAYNDYKEMSILAVQKENSFVDYVSGVGKKVNRVEKGTLSSSEMISNIESENNLMKWILRIIGTLLIVIGYIALLNPIATLTSFIPVLGNVVGGVVTLIGFLVGLIHSLIVIAIAWFRFRPLLSIGLILVVGLLIFLITKAVKKKTSNEIPTNNVVDNTTIQNPQPVQQPMAQQQPVQQPMAQQPAQPEQTQEQQTNNIQNQ